MKTSGKKVSTLYETKISGTYIVKTVVLYLIAAILWYAVCAIVPFAVTVNVGEENAARVSFAALSATESEIAADESTKERALLLPSSEDGFIMRLKLIESAEKKIDFAVFENNCDEWSIYFYSAILRAADRGVKVRLIFDGRIGQFDGEQAELQRILQNHNNIEVYVYNPMNFADPAGLLVFMHDKITVVDGDRMLVGGINMGKYAYLSNADLEVLITNSGETRSVGQDEKYYEKLIKSELSERKNSAKCDMSVRERFDGQYSAFIANNRDKFDEPTDYKSIGVAVDKVTHVHNPIDSHKKEPVIWQAVCNLAENSKETAIVSPYVLLEDAKITKLRGFADNSDKFTIVTNSLYNTRNVAYAHYLYTRRDIVSESLDVYEYQSDDQLHAKFMSFDRRFSLIGSFNMDERSCHIDTESVLVIDSAAFNAQLNALIEDKFVSESLKVGLDNRYEPSDTVAEKPVSFGKKLRYKMFRMLSLVVYLL